NLVPSTVWKSLPIRDLPPIRAGQVIDIDDTIAPVGPEANGSAEVLNHLVWPAHSFQAHCQLDSICGDVSINFPSPKPQGYPVWDNVVLDWHIARDRAGRHTPGPAVLVLDILFGGNRVSGYIAKTLAKNGIHGFVMHMPQNGRRRLPDETHDWSAFLPGLCQAAADARRAKDVIAALPLVEGPVSLQGTSLGGFIATLAGSIDDSFAAVFLALTGGDVFGILKSGRMDAALIRRQLLNAGYDDHRLAEYLWNIEPLRVAHRLNPRRTWLFSARFDQVVRPIHSKQLAGAIGLDWQHQRQIAGCHYTCVFSAPRLLSEIMRAVPRRTPAAIARSA
ncbi:MAG: hypothetical protein ABSF29_11105, partial [Tepidisphaeraceae bacterium]